MEGNAGLDLSAVGVRSTFDYWADVFYDKPLSASGYGSRSHELHDSVAAEMELSTDEWVHLMTEKFPYEGSRKGRERGSGLRNCIFGRILEDMKQQSENT